MNHNTDFFKFKDNFEAISSIKTSLVVGLKETKTTPIISILIPTYKRADLLHDALESALCQKDVENYEIIVVDNNPEYGCETESLVRRFNDKKIFYYKNNQNLGMMGNWNRAFQLSKTIWNILLHDDDVLSPYFISSCLANLNDESIAILKPNNMQFRNIIPSFSKPEIAIPVRVYFSDFMWGCAIGAPTNVVINKNVLIEIGGFNPDFFPSSDYVFSAACAEKYKCFTLPLELGGYRVLDNASLKEEVMISYLKSRFYISSYIMRKLGINLKFITLIQAALIDEKTKRTNEYYNVNYDFDAKQVFSLPALKPFKAKLARHLFRIIKFYFRCRNVLSPKKFWEAI